VPLLFSVFITQPNAFQDHWNGLFQTLNPEDPEIMISYI